MNVARFPAQLQLRDVANKVFARWSLIGQNSQDAVAFYLRGRQKPQTRLVDVEHQRVRNSMGKFPLSIHAIECATDTDSYQQSAWNGLYPMSELRRWFHTFDVNRKRRVKFQAATAMLAWKSSCDSSPTGIPPVPVLTSTIHHPATSPLIASERL